MTKHIWLGDAKLSYEENVALACEALLHDATERPEVITPSVFCCHVVMSEDVFQGILYRVLRHDEKMSLMSGGAFSLSVSAGVDILNRTSADRFMICVDEYSAVLLEKIAFEHHLFLLSDLTAKPPVVADGVMQFDIIEH